MVLNVSMTWKTLSPLAAMVMARTVIVAPTPNVLAQPTASFSVSPARLGKRVGKMSREMIAEWTFRSPETLDMVALSMAASMMPMRPLGSRVIAARA